MAAVKITNGKKYVVPLENNPEVMSKLLHNLGMSQQLAFHDVYSIDEPELLSFVPRPAHALLLVFPTGDVYENYRADADKDKEEYTGHGPDEPVIWYKQTIGNACGLMGLLHGASNGEARKHVDPQSSLGSLIKDAIPLKPVERANLLYESKSLESATLKAGSGGDSTVPEADSKVDLHYVCFVKSDDNRLWELDGARKGPIELGQLGPDEDVLSEKALNVGVRSFLNREKKAGGGNLRFSLICLAPSFD
ncbi:MAG: hypothetical protein Q9162_005793 [Coniocarpon cinnabarinum]